MIADYSTSLGVEQLLPANAGHSIPDGVPSILNPKQFTDLVPCSVKKPPAI